MIFSNHYTQNQFIERWENYPEIFDSYSMFYESGMNRGAIHHLYAINFRSSVRRQRSVNHVSSIISAGLKCIVIWSLSVERNISAIYRIIIIQWSARIHDSLYTLFAPKSPLIPDCFVKAAIIHGRPCFVKRNL